MSGTSSDGRYSRLSMYEPSGKGNKAFKKLFSNKGCSPKTFQKVRLLLVSRYFIAFFTKLQFYGSGKAKQGSVISEYLL
jgi:hypothetical protein